MRKENFRNLQKFSLDYNLSHQQAALFENYIELLEKWHPKTNMVSKKDITRLVDKHIVESIFYYDPQLFDDSSTVLDVGSGGGFPGIPLKIMYPNLTLLLVEARRRKALFLQEVAEQLSLRKTNVICDRVENLNVEPVDIVTARAVSSLLNLWDWDYRHLREGGALITIKGAAVSTEMETLKSRYHNFRVQLKNIFPPEQARVRVVLIKSEKTL